MGLYKRGQVWWMRFTHNGDVVKRSTETRDKKLADKVYCKVMTQITEGTWFERPLGEGITLREMLDKYLKEYSLRNKSKSSISSDGCMTKNLNRYLGDMYITDISPRAISDYKSRRREEGVSPKTVNNELVMLNHAFNLAMKEWEWVRENPVSRVSREKVNNLMERWLTYTEETVLLAESPEWLREITTFAINTGLRQSEILNLQWSKVDFNRRTLTILEQKNKGRDTLPLNNRALEVLKAREKVKHINGYVFYNGNGNRIDARNLLRAYYSARKKAGLEDLRFHDLRHTFATRLAQAGVDLYKVQKLMRHKTPLMTQRYAHHYPESLRDGVEVLDRLGGEFGTILEHCNKKGLGGNLQTLEFIGCGERI